MSGVVHEPSRELRRLATRIDFACGAFLGARGNGAAHAKWEALRHAWLLSNLALRHTEATVLMARTDVVMQPSAWVTARAAVEATARCLWLLEPDDVWDREGRWIALLEEGARLGERSEMTRVPHYAKEAAGIRAFSEGVAAKLPEGTVIPRTPTVRQILEVHGEPFLRFYALASQYVHAAELPTRQWRLHFGVEAEYGDFSSVQGWTLPLLNSWQSFRATALALTHVTGASVPPSLALIDAQVAEATEEFLASQEKA